MGAKSNFIHQSHVLLAEYVLREAAAAIYACGLFNYTPTQRSAAERAI
jgi:hypothetical protein